MILCWITLAVLCILVRENEQIPQQQKKAFYMTYALIALAAFAERLGVYLDGRTELPVSLLRFVKACDYILTPMAGASFVEQMRVRQSRRNLMVGVLAFNTLFQLVSCFTGWMIVIDENHHYVHGPLYGIYVVCYLTIIALLVLEFIDFGKSYHRQNRESLYGIMVLMLVGILMQELLGAGTHRTVYLAMTMSAALMLIHGIEFSQMTVEERLAQQYKQMMTDPLTGMMNRRAFEKQKLLYETGGELPPSLVVVMLDINGLKETNDRFGHEAGDELIWGASECIKTAFGERGSCYRIGGDEFVVLSDANEEEMKWILQILALQQSLWSGENVKVLSMSVGCARAGDYPGLNFEKLIFEADQKMYSEKSRYYQASGHDRRRADRAEPPQKRSDR